MRAEKNQIVQEILGLIENKPIILIRFTGLTAAKFGSFRTTLADLSAECHVVPNKLILKAAEKAGITCLAEQSFKGETVLVSGDCDPVAMAKAVNVFVKAKENKDLVNIRLGVVEGQLLNSEDVSAFAELPPREVLLAQLLGLLEAPAGQLVRVLNAKVSSVVYVLNAFLNKKEQAA
ncbi:MAG: 50S ribosomal protein L10 [Lentisphaeria bacterium]